LNHDVSLQKLPQRAKVQVEIFFFQAEFLAQRPGILIVARQLHVSRAFQMEGVMTPAAAHDEIFFAVRPQLASPNHVVDLELIAPATVLGEGPVR
jgi:hypothetical protein